MGRIASNPFHVEKSDLRITRSGHQRLGGFVGRFAVISLDRHLHVGLPRADPHFADQYVVEHQFLAIADLDRIRPSGRRRRDLRQPPALRIGCNRILRTVPRSKDRYRFQRRSPAPKIHPGFPLQHHIAAQNSRQFDFRRCSGYTHQQKNSDQQFSHDISIFIIPDSTLPTSCEKTVRLTPFHDRQQKTRYFNHKESVSNRFMGTLSEMESRSGLNGKIYAPGQNGGNDLSPPPFFISTVFAEIHATGTAGNRCRYPYPCRSFLCRQQSQDTESFTKKVSQRLRFRSGRRFALFYIVPVVGTERKGR